MRSTHHYLVKSASPQGERTEEVPHLKRNAREIDERRATHRPWTPSFPPQSTHSRSLSSFHRLGTRQRLPHSCAQAISFSLQSIRCRRTVEYGPRSPWDCAEAGASGSWIRAIVCLGMYPPYGYVALYARPNNEVKVRTASSLTDTMEWLHAFRNCCQSFPAGIIRPRLSLDKISPLNIRYQS